MDVEGARSFMVSGAAYDLFMGRYARVLAPLFAETCALAPRDVVLDVGCGPGALTAELVARLGVAQVRAVDPSPSFVAACADRMPGLWVREGRAEQLPVPDASVNAVFAQLVLPFVSDPDRAAAEFRRVVRPGGAVAACIWDYAEGMRMLRLFWDAALEGDPDAPAEERVLRFSRDGEIAELLSGAGFVDLAETRLRVESTYADFAELWAGFCAGIGPAGSYLLRLRAPKRARLRAALFERLGSPTGPFTVEATARSASGRAPG